ncbi:hypothetical protein BV25DRAFT_1986338 [Artomyces pyxidatus]|uniref:Uncharacterized protein n=1 Tax=Artomyces pyxidatus TaxID=48021 RepID=A0ACB8TK51_9AGAM|nr:hypothetical protein BV25DRAFT_1986338 [Artomyces pyxidatus]
MKYVALLSGGKDSCYNLLHCRKNGHELVAAASLGPEAGKEELDSYLYQTVGQDAIELVARALDVPIFRRVISGTAVEQGAEYGGRDAKNRGGTVGDETEDLYALLADVKSHHPDVEGVSVGAILSSYQRVRVEHVCMRLSLTPLCYLWQRDQAELLSEMIAAGMEAILIKVAGIGLTTKHLGQTLAQMEPTFIKLNTLYGSHICGEGGEYETLTLDCQMFKQRITLVDTETVVHSDSDFATVAFLRVKNARLDPKISGELSQVAVPPLLDEGHLVAEETISIATTESHDQASSTWFDSVLDPPQATVSTKRVDDWVAITNVLAINTVVALTLEDEVRECFRALQTALEAHSLLLSNVANINIFLSSMDYFAQMNAIYSTFFGTSPPARACVAVDLPSPCRVKLDCVAYAEQGPSDRQALHVQSVSYWAPANIGPYSQAITVGERIFISGQIGLIPSSMTLPSPRASGLEAALVRQHTDRILEAFRSNTGGGWAGHAQCIIHWFAHGSDLHRVTQDQSSKIEDAPVLFVEVKDLPKNALVEKQVLYHTGRGLVNDEDGEPEVISKAPKFYRGNLSDDDIIVHWELSQFDHTSASAAVICGKGFGDSANISRHLKAIKPLQAPFANSFSVRLFHKRNTPVPKLYYQLFSPSEGPALTTIPCRYISTRDYDDWDYAMCIIAS